MSTIGGSPGINSGLNITSMVTAMVTAERAPKDAQLARLEKASTTKFSALGQLKGSINSLQDALKELNKPDLFNKRVASSSDSAKVSASADATAVAGSYKVEVSALAASSKVATQSLNKTYTASASGSLQVSLGADGPATNVAISAGDDLVAIRDKLNTALKDQGITANVVNDPVTGTSRLVLNGKTTGAGKDIYIESADPALSDLTIGSIDRTDPAHPVGSLSAVAGNAAGYLTQAADAQFSIDGLALSSSSNSVSDAISGVTLNLSAKTEAGKPLTIDVGEDRAGVKASLKKFVDAYNGLMKTSSELTSVVSAGEGKPPVIGGLVGDSSVRNLLSAVRGELGRMSGGDADGLRTLADLGITTQRDGTLKIDDSKLDKALKDNFNAVGGFLTGDTGLMTRLNKSVQSYTQTGGILEQRMSALTNTLKDVDKQKAALNLRMDKVQQRLLDQFNAMDALVGQLNSTSDRLTQALGSLPGAVKKES